METNFLAFARQHADKRDYFKPESIISKNKVSALRNVLETYIKLWIENVHYVPKAIVDSYEWLVNQINSNGEIPITDELVELKFTYLFKGYLADKFIRIQPNKSLVRRCLHFDEQTNKVCQKYGIPTISNCTSDSSNGLPPDFFTTIFDSQEIIFDDSMFSSYINNSIDEWKHLPKPQQNFILSLFSHSDYELPTTFICYVIYRNCDDVINIELYPSQVSMIFFYIKLTREPQSHSNHWKASLNASPALAQRLQIF